ncbi:MAG: hydrogenase iron-sulfur subunit [Mariprofundaceae bacterium]|nr:hydrogenase iron-sulfur subunit [Mariprofundaceae bacterium]
MNNSHQGNFIFRFLKSIQYGGRWLFQLAEAGANSVFGAKNNPMYYLGGLAFFFFYVLFFSGVYVYIFYDTEVSGAYASIEYMTHEQWYLAGVMRSLHRYASDAMVVAMVLHMMRRFFNDRYNGGRSFSWITGMPMIWMVLITGLLGYWLVWDEMAQFIAVRTFEWIDWLPIIAEPTARNFLSNEHMTDTLFRLLVVTHLGLPLIMLAGMLIHINRLHHPKVNPPRPLMIGMFMALLVLSLVKPALSHAPADLGVAPSVINFDWFYMGIYALMGSFSMGTVWAIVVGATVFAMLLPWLPPKKRDPAAVVDLSTCSGCNLCVLDCPYEAIRLEPRSDGNTRYTQEARVIADKCVSCGICTGSCPYSVPFRHTDKLVSAIEMPHFGIQKLRNDVDEAMQQPGEQKIFVFGCSHGVGKHVTGLDKPDVVGVNVECSGMLPPTFVDYALRQGAAGVVVTGCRDGDCYHRLGNQFTGERLNRERKPELSHKVAPERVRFVMGAEADKAKLDEEIEAFHSALAKLDDGDDVRHEKEKGGTAA